MQVFLAKPRRKVAGLWTLVATLLILASAQPTAYGLDFPATTRLTLPEATSLRASTVDLTEGAPLYSQLEFAQSHQLIQRFVLFDLQYHLINQMSC